MIKLILLLLCIHAAVAAWASRPDGYNNDTTLPQAVYLEAGGAGINISLYYDIHLNKRPGGFGVRLGTNGKIDDITTITGGAYYLLGKRKNFLELSLNETAVKYDNVDNTQNYFYTGDYKIQSDNPPFMYVDMPPGKTMWVTSMGIGYRLQPFKGGFFLKAGAIGLITNKGTSSSGIYLALGATF